MHDFDIIKLSFRIYINKNVLSKPDVQSVVELMNISRSTLYKWISEYSDLFKSIQTLIHFENSNITRRI